MLRYRRTSVIRDFKFKKCEGCILRIGHVRIYKRQFLDLMKARQIEDKVPRDRMEGACLLCSEEKPDHCHRRLVAEYLKEKWHDTEIEHIT